MANRRMFSLDIVNTDKFLEMPMTAQALYFHLGMRADDDGFVASPVSVLRMVGGCKDDLSLLFAKGFVIPFNSGVCVVRHWKSNNYIQSDRYRPAIHVEEKALLTEDRNVYEFAPSTTGVIDSNPVSDLDTRCIQHVSIMDTQVRLELDNPSGRNCPDCGAEIMLYDIPYIGVIGREVECQCVKDQKEQKRLDLVTKGTAIIRKEMREDSGMGKRYQLYTFGRFKRSEGNGAALDAALRFVEDYCAGQAKYGGLMLCGNAGTGKTFLACAIANGLIDRRPIKDDWAEKGCDGWNGYNISSPVTFFGMADLLQRVRSSFNGQGAGENGAELIERAKSAKLLILDDFGAEKISDWVREVVYDIIEFRYQNVLHTVLTTNETPISLKEKYGERIADRVRNMCVTVPMTGKSQRRTAAMPASSEKEAVL